MEESLEKLKILDYEEEFCKTNNNDLITRTQFAMPSSNPAENFKTFAALVQWLMALNGNYTEQWDRFTDPNVTVTNMMNELRKVGINTELVCGDSSLLPLWARRTLVPETNVTQHTAT